MENYHSGGSGAFSEVSMLCISIFAYICKKFKLYNVIK